MLLEVVKETNDFIKTPGNHTYTFDVTNLSNGIYFYSVKDGKGVTSRKIVVSRKRFEYLLLQ